MLQHCEGGFSILMSKNCLNIIIKIKVWRELRTQQYFSLLLHVFFVTHEVL